MKFENLLSELKGTSKPTEKQAVLRSYDSEQLRYILKATYDPFLLSNVKIKPKDVPAPSNHDLGEIFEEVEAVLRFCQSSKSAKRNREMVILLLEKLNEGSQELFVGILNKNWKVGISRKGVLKLYPGLFKQFIVQLANTFDPDKEKHQLDRWIISYKLDGLRCVAIRQSSDDNYDKGKWTLYSRQGKEFLTVNHLKSQLEKLYSKSGWTFFDGELYKHGLTFEEVQGPVMAFTKGQVPDMEYHIFVAGSADKFLTGEDPNHVEPIAGPSQSTHLHFVNQGFISADLIEERLEESFEKGYEGIMLRDPDNLYDYKRSNALLKLKRRLNEDEDAHGEVISDCMVISVEYNDSFPVIADGKLHTERLLTRIWVQQEDGIECKVGSGFSLEFRRQYTENTWDLIGRKVEVKHQMWGAEGRMRFPRLFRVRDDL